MNDSLNAVRRTVGLLLLGGGVSASLLWGPVRLSFAEPVPLVGTRPTKPAVQIVGVRAVAEPTPEAIVRAAPNVTPQPFDPFFDPKAVVAPRTAAQPMPEMFDPRLQPPPQNRGVFSTVTNWTSDRVKAIKTSIAGPPEQPPLARVGQQAPPPMPMGQPAMPMGQVPQPMANQPFRGTTAGGRPAYAGNPAYRWYGWGTTTPGANAYAPTGEYPTASGQWYAMSGATPGAFPVPVTAPFRNPPGVEPPAYASRTPAVRTPAPNFPAPSFATVETPPSAMTGPRTIAESMPFRYVPPDELPVSTPVAPAVPSASSSEWRGWGPQSSNVPQEPPAPVRPNNTETNWQPVTYTAPIPMVTTTSTTMIGQSAPPQRESEPMWQPRTNGLAPTLLDRVKAACGPGVTGVEVKRLGADNVIVRFDAPTDAVAEAAAKAISRLTELQPFVVTFDAVVSGK